MKQTIKLLLVSFLILSIGLIYAQPQIDKKKDEIVKEKTKIKTKRTTSIFIQSTQ